MKGPFLGVPVTRIIVRGLFREALISEWPPLPVSWQADRGLTWQGLILSFSTLNQQAGDVATGLRKLWVYARFVLGTLLSSGFRTLGFLNQIPTLPSPKPEPHTKTNCRTQDLHGRRRHFSCSQERSRAQFTMLPARRIARSTALLSYHIYYGLTNFTWGLISEI